MTNAYEERLAVKCRDADYAEIIQQHLTTEKFPEDSLVASRIQYKRGCVSANDIHIFQSQSSSEVEGQRINFEKMNFLLISLAVLCAIVCTVEAQRNRGFPGHNTAPNRFPRPLFKHRFRRDAPEEPQGSIVLQGRQPLSGPDRHPTLDLNYNHRIIDNDRTKLDAFGGANLYRGHVSPQAGFGVEHRFKNDIFVRGQGQVEQGFGGRLSPSFGAGLGWRFRRDAPEEPQGSIVLQGRQPLSGLDRQPTLDLNYNHRIIDNDRTKLDAFGGANLYRGHVSPQAGFGVEHRFKNDIFVRGQGQVERGFGGRLSPSFGAGVGWRFRREALPYEEEEEAVEEVY